MGLWAVWSYCQCIGIYEAAEMNLSGLGDLTLDGTDK